MAGAYTHLTLVALLGSPTGIKGLGNLPLKTLAPLLSYSKYTELGSISPDYPYMDITSKAAKGWANAMHLERAGDRLRCGMEYVRNLTGENKYKGLAWILGFAAHVITDVVVHPVVELKVGPYAENATAHRTCEMHQDVFIYKLMNVGEIYLGNFIHNGIAACSDPDDKKQLDPDIRNIWRHMLQVTDAARFQEERPDFRAWHGKFREMLTTAGAGKLLAFGRHYLASTGLQFPDKPSDEYIRNLSVPGGKTMNFDEIFAKATDEVRFFWGLICRYCLTDEIPDLSSIRNWSLDTGKDENGLITLWE